MYTDTITLSYTVVDQETGNQVAKQLYQVAKGFTATARVRTMIRIFDEDGSLEDTEGLEGRLQDITARLTRLEP